MKQIVRSILYFFLTLLTSCELSMQEYVVSEDQRGKGEPYTERTQYGEFTYEYNDNVTPLNGDPQNYIATMNDSVIWFMDNLPQKWMPKAGEYIAANCSKTIPLGLCSKVRSVTREEGMIRVEYEPATRKEVFKKLKLKIDFDYVAPAIKQTIGDSTVETRSTRTINRPGFWKNDSTFVDMSLFEPETRGNDSEDEHGPVDEEHEEESNELKFAKPIPIGDEYLYVEFSAKCKEYIRVHQWEDSEADYYEEWNDRYTERTFKFLVGFGKDPESASKKLWDYPKGVEEDKQIRELFSRKNIMKYLKDQEGKLNEHNFSLPIPSCPISLMFRADFRYGFTVMAYGYAELKYVSEAKRVGYKIENKKKTQIEEPVKIWHPNVEPGLHWGDIRAGGSFDIWLRARGGVGVILGGAGAGVGGVVGIEAKGGFKATLETESLTDHILTDKNNFSAGFYFSWGGFFEGITKFGPVTVSLGDFNFLVTEYPFMSNMKAKVDKYKSKTEMYVEKKYDDETGELVGEDLCINTDLNFEKLETFFLFPNTKAENQRPALRIYEGAKNEGSRKVHQVVLDELLVAKKTYKFNENLTEAGLKPSDKNFTVVPCIYDKETGIITEYKENAMFAASAEPYITMPAQLQVYGREISEEDWESYLSLYGDELQGKTRDDFAEYIFSSIVEVKHSTRIKEWGIKVEMYDDMGKKILTQKIPYNFEGVCPSGDFTFVFTFISEVKWPMDEDDHVGLSVYSTPYAICEGDKEPRKFSKSKSLDLRNPFNGGFIPTLGETQYEIL